MTVDVTGKPVRTFFLPVNLQYLKLNFKFKKRSATGKISLKIPPLYDEEPHRRRILEGKIWWEGEKGGL
jgi:hypothetical protein